jgi:hypothetical protein
MTVRTRAALKTYFETGDQPNQVQFSDWLDSTIIQEDLGTNVATALAANVNSANGTIQLTVTGALPAVDGSNLTGVMLASVYDTGNIQDDCFNRANHTGLQTIATISDWGTNVATALGNAVNSASGLLQLDASGRIIASADVLVDTGGTHVLGNPTFPFKALDLGQTSTASSGQDYAINIENTYNQSGTAASRDLQITRNETALGSGYQQFINCNVAGTDKFAVTNTGKVVGNQGTADAAFINFEATADADATSAISTLTTSGSTTHHIQIEINGVTAWIAASTTDPT